MAQQTINVGTAPNDGTGTPLRTAFQYTNSNFSELYTAVGPSGNNIVVPGSATITGDLTVDTNTLKVDSANNRVGVNKSIPAVDLDVGGSARFQSTGTNWMEFGVNVLTSNQATGASIRSVVSSAGNPTYSWTGDSDTGLFNDSANSIGFAIGGSEGMRLNSTGLGVGISSPFADAGYKSIDLRGTTGGEVVLGSSSVREATITADGTNGMILNTVNSTPLRFYTQGGEKMRIDTSGNVGIGVTPVTGGKLTVAGPIVRNKGNATLTQNVATTVATLPGEGLFIAYAYTNASNPSAFTSYAVILCDSVGSRVIANNGTQISITTSTFALQVTQIFAATLNVVWSFVQIG